MPRIVTFDCPSCGAPVKTPDDVLAVHCDYCGNNLTVPQHLRPASPQIAHLPGTNIFINTSESTPTERGQRHVYIRPSPDASRKIRRGLCCTGVLIVLFIIVLTALPIVIAGWTLFDVFKQFSSIPRP